MKCGSRLQVWQARPLAVQAILDRWGHLDSTICRYGWSGERTLPSLSRAGVKKENSSLRPSSGSVAGVSSTLVEKMDEMGILGNIQKDNS